MIVGDSNRQLGISFNQKVANGMPDWGNFDFDIYSSFIPVNYHDLTKTSMECWIVRRIVPIQPYFSFLNCYLPRFLDILVGGLEHCLFSIYL